MKRSAKQSSQRSCTAAKPDLIDRFTVTVDNDAQPVNVEEALADFLVRSSKSGPLIRGPRNPRQTTRKRVGGAHREQLPQNHSASCGDSNGCRAGGGCTGRAARRSRPEGSGLRGRNREAVGLHFVVEGDEVGGRITPRSSATATVAVPGTTTGGRGSGGSDGDNAGQIPLTTAVTMTTATAQADPKPAPPPTGRGGPRPARGAGRSGLD